MSRNKHGQHPAKRPGEQPERRREEAVQQGEIFPGAVQYEEFHVGPLPPPQTIHEYNQILPGLADRIVLMAEREAGHRHWRERRSLWFNGSAQILGVLFAGAIGLTAVGGGIYAMLTGAAADFEGAGVAALGLTSLVGVFITGKYMSQRRPRNPQQ